MRLTTNSALDPRWLGSRSARRFGSVPSSNWSSRSTSIAATSCTPPPVTKAYRPSAEKTTSVGSAKKSLNSSSSSWSTRPSGHSTPIPLVMIQPCTLRVMGTRFFVRISVTSAKSPDGANATPWTRLASGTERRRATVDRSASMTVTSEVSGARNSPYRGRLLVT